MQLNTLDLQKLTDDEDDQIKSAFGIMIKIAQDYKDGKLTKEQLKDARTESVRQWKETHSRETPHVC